MPAAPAEVSWGKYLLAALPALVFWLGLIGGVAYLIAEGARSADRYDRDCLVEWLDENRPYRKNLQEVVEEYLELPEPTKADEIAAQLAATVEPLRMFANGLPQFIEVYRLRVDFPTRPELPSIEWRSPVPPLKAQQGRQVRADDLLEIVGRDGSRAVVHCEYRMHAFNKQRQQETQTRRARVAVAAVLVGGSVLALLSVTLFVRRERRRAGDRLEQSRALAESERRLLQQNVELARQQARASEAERTTLEMKSQLYAGIGIMAGSYAHNIKNLLVRPNDLLARCLEGDKPVAERGEMLREVQLTLGTVTERLQQILRTVRRDPNRAELAPVDLGRLIRDAGQTWAATARDKWKMVLSVQEPIDALPIRGDLSHLQQALENLLFNARDATFEMRSHVREAARALHEPAARKRAIVEAAAWKGEVGLRAFKVDGEAVLEVRDNGIGMTEEVLRQCAETHFTTKRDNALFEGYSAGMGLGLSFVVMVLDHHGAGLTIDSEPLRGATFRVRLPLAGD